MARISNKARVRKCPVCRLVFRPMTDKQYAAALKFHMKTRRHREALETLGRATPRRDAQVEGISTRLRRTN